MKTIRRRRPLLGLALACLLVPAALPASGPAAPAARPATVPTAPAALSRAPARAADRTTADLLSVLRDLTSPKAAVRETAHLRLKNLPADAYEPVRDLLRDGDLPPEIAAAARGAVEALAIRHARVAARRADYAWLARAAGDAYARFGTHDPKWDDAARAALASLGPTGAEVGDEDVDEQAALARRLAAFGRAAAGGCGDPLVATYWVRCQLDAAPVDHEALMLEVFAPSMPLARPELPPGIGDRARDAADKIAHTDYPDYFKCLARQTAARAILDAAANRNDAQPAGDQGNAAFDVIAGALKTPGCPARWQWERVLEQHQLGARMALARSDALALGTLCPAYDAAAPNAVGPVLYRAEVHISAAFLIHDGTVPVANPAEAEQKHLAQAAELLEKAWKMGPHDGKTAGAMIVLMILRGDDRPAMEEWFRRAMAADPDNVGACRQKLFYLDPRWHGSEQELIDFGRDCLAGGNFRGRVALTLMDAHIKLMREGRRGQDYFRRPAVWEDVRASYEACIRAYLPSEGPPAIDRSAYANWAQFAGHDDVALAQVAAMGERADLRAWGSRQAYDDFRLAVSRSARAAETGGKPPQYPAPRGMDPGPAAGRVTPAAAAALAKIGDRGGNLGPDNLAGALAVAADFPELAVSAEAGKSTWNRVTLNATRQRFDCVRFRAPKGGPRDMRWAQVYRPEGVAAWYIVRVDGKPMDGFEDYFPPVPLRGIQSGVRGPGDGGEHAMILQTLPAANLEPGAEYLLWFRFENNQPTRYSIAITFVPPAKERPEFLEALKELGMRWVGR